MGNTGLVIAKTHEVNKHNFQIGLENWEEYVNSPTQILFYKYMYYTFTHVFYDNN